MKSIMIIGGDKRSAKLSELLSGKYNVKTVLLGKEENYIEIKNSIDNIKDYDAVVLPIPYSRDGVSIHTLYSDHVIKCSDVLKKLDGSQILFYGGISSLPVPYVSCEKVNIIKNDMYSQNNAFLTAKGIEKILEDKENSISGKKIVITGYGKIASYLTKMLTAKGADVYIAARKEKARDKAISEGAKGVSDINKMSGLFAFADYIINTVPEKIFTQNDLRLVSARTKVIDISSVPHGFSQEEAEKANVNITLEQGIPGRFYPLDEAKCMFEIIEEYLKEA